MAIKKKCKVHEGHGHRHGPGCGHLAIAHGGHTDYLHDGHLHHLHGNHVCEHELEANGLNPAVCTLGHTGDGHEKSHVHGPGCGHEPVPHAGHVDYLVEGHLHCPHAGHCDDHGPVTIR
jgi:hypothetical protein